MAIDEASRTITSRATEAVAAVCPIIGMSFGDIADKATWGIAFHESATAEQRAAAAAAMSAFDPSAPTREDVDAERDRRIALGATVTVGGAMFVVQTRDERDFRNITGLVVKGIVLGLQADATTTVPFRDAGNVSRSLTGAQLIAMGVAVAAHVQSVYAASWALKTMVPIPADYASDVYW